MKIVRKGSAGIDVKERLNFRRIIYHWKGYEFRFFIVDGSQAEDATRGKGNFFRQLPEHFVKGYAKFSVQSFPDSIKAG
jgi:hypothetical protein